MPRKSKEPSNYIAVCTVCLNRRINKQTQSEVIRIANKNGWSQYLNKVESTITFICPDCKKEGYDFE